MNIAVRANVRTTEAARSGLNKALTVAFRGGAITGMLVAGLGLLGIAGYYAILIGLHHNESISIYNLVKPMVGMAFGGSLDFNIGSCPFAPRFYRWCSAPIDILVSAILTLLFVCYFPLVRIVLHL